MFPLIIFGFLIILSPLNNISPEDGLISVTNILIKVDLPAPFSPIIPITSPGSISKEISSITSLLLYFFVMLQISSKAI